MDIYAQRKAALKKIAERVGGNTKLADKLGYSTGFLSQIIGPSAHRTIGEKLARKIEAKLKMKRGSLDGPAPADVARAAAGLDVELMRDCVTQLNDALQAEGVKVSNDAFAEILSMLYLAAQRGDIKDAAEVSALIRLASR